MNLLVRRLGLMPYEPVWRAMQAFTDQRDGNTEDELWLLQHPPVFTQGQAGKPEHLLAPGDIPVVQVDRGGQVTYHGPGQIVAYPLLDIERRGISVRELVCGIEQVIIDLLAGYGLETVRREGAPGVYLDEAKIAALGLRVRRGFSYHGLALNVAMDLSPYERINPCGFARMPITQMSAHVTAELPAVEADLTGQFARHFGYNIVLNSQRPAVLEATVNDE